MRLLFIMILFLAAFFLIAIPTNAAQDQLLYSMSEQGIIGIINTNTQAYSNNTSFPSANTVYISSNPGGTLLALSDFINDKVIFINPGDNRLIASVNVYSPFGSTFSNDGKILYVADFYDSRLYFIDTTNFTIQGYTQLDGTHGYIVALSNDAQKVYVSCFDSPTTNNICIINTQTKVISGHLTTSLTNTSNMIMTSDDKLIVSNNKWDPGSNGTIDIYDTNTDTLIHTINTYNWPYGLAIDYSHDYLYVSALDSGASKGVILKYDLSSYAQSDKIVFDLVNNYEPSDLKRANNNHLFVGTYDTIYIFDLNNNNNNIGTIDLNNGVNARFTLVTPAEETTVFVPPHQVLIKVQSLFGLITYSNVQATVSYASNNTILYSAATDDTGSVSFMLVPTTQYIIHVYNTTQGIDETLTVYPQDTSYSFNIIPLPNLDITNLFLNGSSQNIETGQSWALNLTSNVGTIYTTYTDEGNSTTSVNFSLYSKNPLANTPPAYVSSNVYALAPSGNVLPNPGFEAGSLYSWSPTSGVVVASNTTRSGSYSAYFNGTGGFIVYNYTTPVAGETWALTVWLKGTVNNTGVLIRARNSTGYELGSSTKYVTATYSSWTQLSTQYTIPAGTNHVWFEVYSAGTSNHFLDDCIASSNSINNTFTINNAGGKEYLVTVNGTSSQYGENSHSYGVTFPGATVTIGEIPQDWYQWLSFLIILIIAGLGTAVTGPITLIAVALCAIIFGAFGWFNPLSSWAMDGAISLTFLMGLGWYIIQKEREG